jgi:ABC-2 type transport system permease protein
MSGFAVVFRADVSETLRARWYQVYIAAFALLMGLFFAFGLGDSSVMGFVGIGRILMTFIQIAMIILPIFVLVTTARTLVGDRELGVWEYLLALPLGLKSFYWGKTLGRVTALAVPLCLGVLLAGGFEALGGGKVPWGAVALIGLFIGAMVACFVGVAILVSVVAPTQEIALGAAFVLWLASEAMIDALLLGLLVKQRLPPEVVVGLALLNPLQAFRTASIALFDPELTVFGPISLTILETYGRAPLLAWAALWPLVLGTAAALLGAWLFVRKDVTA